MVAKYLIDLVEEFANENNLDISELYKKMAEIYQETYGVNIDLQMREEGQFEMPQYLESKGIVERYVHILNELKKEWRG